jgi:isoamylase
MDCAVIILNGYSEPLEFELPSHAADGQWKRWIDTSLASPEDITDWQSAKSFTGKTYQWGPRSVVMLFAENHEPLDASTHHSN